jgi:hypothetical protein
VLASGWRVKASGLVGSVVIAMGGSRKWSVESKDFELSIKGGNLGVRIVERSNGKQSSVFIHRDELAWLLDSVEAGEKVETSEVFWDQSRARVPRVILKYRANRNGRFMSVEEFDGRRRNGIILIPEGRLGQGWKRLTSELKKARSSLWEGRAFNLRKPERKPEIGAVGRRNFAEVVGASKSKTHEQTASVGDSNGPGGWVRPVGGSSEMAVQLPEKCNMGMGVAYSVGKQLVKGQEEKALNVTLELGYCREWLRKLRDEVDVGLGRIEAALKDFESAGPDLGREVKDRALKSIKTNPVKSDWRPKLGPGPGSGPSGNIKPKDTKLTGEGPTVGVVILSRPEEKLGSPGPGLDYSKPGEVGLGSISKLVSVVDPTEAAFGESVCARSVTEEPPERDGVYCR